MKKIKLQTKTQKEKDLSAYPAKGLGNGQWND